MTLETITSDALHPVRHAFFTRKGGASSGVFAGLNCGRGSSDQADVVTINRTRVSRAMGTEPDKLIALHQTHSSDVLIYDAPQDGAAPKADGVATRVEGLLLSVLTADCAPVLFSDPEAGVVGAAHAGWRGALGGVLEATLEAMERLGAEASQTSVVVGPTISQRSYEVGEEFLEQFLSEDAGYDRFFVNGQGNKYQFDLPMFAIHKLREAGVGHAEWTGHCTYEDADRFFSYRRSVHEKQADYGRLIATIRL